MTRVMEVIDYNPNWPHMFASEAKALKNALGENCKEIYHIGSTSVPGLSAKPVIDIMIAVQDISKIDKEELSRLGYKIRGELGMPFRLFCNKGEPRTHHLHIWEANNPEIKKHILFRDFLRNNPDYMQKYADLKYELAEKYRIDRKKYTESKDSLIKEIVKKSGFNEPTVVQVNLPREWEAFNNILQDLEPITSEDDIYFVLMQGADIEGAAHIKKGKRTKILSLKCKTPVQEIHMENLLERWIKDVINN